MYRTENHIRFQRLEHKICIIRSAIKKLEGELPDAEGSRKIALLKVICMGQNLLTDLKRLFH